MRNSFFARSDEVVWFPVQNGLSLHNLENDCFFSLEEGVASYLWENLDGSQSLNELIHELATLCKCSVDGITDEIIQFVQSLLDKELIFEVKREDQ